MMSETQTKKKRKIDYESPAVQDEVNNITHGTFVKQGTMLAFPTGFPGATIPILADESHITALDTSRQGFIYGGTSGKRAHIFVGMFHGVTGMIFDMHAAEGATACTAVCCGRTKFLACVNGPSGGGRILTSNLEPWPYDLIQEWGFRRHPFDDLGEGAAGEPIVHAVADTSRDHVVGVTTHHLFTVDFAAPKVQVAEEVSGSGRLALGSKGSILGPDGAGHLWCFDPQSRKLQREAFKLPAGQWNKTPGVWARVPHTGLLYTADDDGQLFSFDEERGFSASLGKTMFAPVTCMAATFDGRVFGSCGDGIAKMFCFDPGSRKIADIGVAVSLFQRRRYGYVFGDAVTGRDGEIVFGEDDDGGHLWLYFPRIQAAKA
jgi:hypothetical protein